MGASSGPRRAKMLEDPGDITRCDLLPQKLVATGRSERDESARPAKCKTRACRSARDEEFPKCPGAFKLHKQGRRSDLAYTRGVAAPARRPSRRW